METMGAQPVYSVGGTDGGFGAEGMGIWIILLFFILVLGGNGFGGNARGEISNDFLYTNLAQNQNSNFLQLANDNIGINRALCEGFAGVNANLAENRFASQLCCCETNRNIDSVKFENAMNTTNITNTIRDEGNATRALITENLITDLREQLNESRRQADICAQNDLLVNQIRPVATPAYLTCSPYVASSANCGCGF